MTPAASPARAAALALPAVLVALLLAGCTPSDADREASYLSHAQTAADEAGVAWDESESERALTFGRALCADWEERTTGDRSVDIAGSQASVQLAGGDEAATQARLAYVQLASDDLCPV